MLEFIKCQDDVQIVQFQLMISQTCVCHEQFKSRNAVFICCVLLANVRRAVFQKCHVQKTESFTLKEKSGDGMDICEQYYVTGVF